MSCKFQGDLNGHRGLVPSNFLQALPEEPQPAAEPRRDSQVALRFYLVCTAGGEHVGILPTVTLIIGHFHITKRCLITCTFYQSLCCVISCFFNSTLHTFFCPIVSCMAFYRSTNELYTLRHDCKCKQNCSLTCSPSVSVLPSTFFCSSTPP